MRRTLIIIDNSATDCELYRSMLTGVSDAEYAVHCVSSGDEGLELIESERPDCVLLDYGLPGQGSHAAWNRIRARYPALPLVMLTGEDVEYDALEAMRVEGQEYIRKTAASPETLHLAVANTILAGLSREEGPRPAGTLSLLIIDDNPDDREAFIRSLKQIDPRYRCAEAGDGMSGIALMQQTHPDCVLLDYSLPAHNGLQVMRRIHAIDAFMPVIMLTGLGNEGVAVQAVKSGAHNYIVKTALTPGLLHSAITSAVEHSLLERKINQQRTQLNEQKRALAQSAQLNEAVLSSAAYIVIATTIKGEVLLFNPEAERQLGYSAGEIIGKQTPLLWLDSAEVTERAETLSAEYRAVIEPDFSVLSEKATLDGVTRQEWTCVRRDGGTFTANFTISSLRDGRGAVTGFLIVGEDITVRKAQQDALKAREELFRSAMEHAPNGMAFIDTGGRFLKVNGALCELLGYTAEQLQGKHQDSVTDPEDIEIDLEDVRQLLSEKIQSYKVEKRLIREDGSAVYVLLAMSLMHDDAGTPQYFVAQVQDITDRKEIERIKTDFVSVVSHELRTPVTSIRGAVGLISAIAGDALPARGRQLIEIAINNCDRLVTLVNDILDIDRMVNGQMRLEMKDEDVSALLQEAIEAHRGYNEKLGVSVVMEPMATNLMVNVDAARLIQVLFNLLSNATKHSPEGGQIRVGTTRVGGTIRIWVKDQGAGVDPELAKHIFEKFSHRGVTRGPKGTGLGLHISKQIIEKMGGEIGLDAMGGAGSTFWVELPDSQATAATIPIEGRAAPTKRILVCEDDDNLAALIQLMLGREGYAADIVHTVPEARRKLNAGEYDAMTLDLTLPLGDGLDLARELHRAPETHNFPIVVVSGRYREEQNDLQGDAGIIDWIVKPFDRERLVRSVAKAASGHLKLAQSA